MLRVLKPLLISMVLCPAAFAKEAVVMVNMNYSSEELRAAREVANARGQEFHVVPPESLIPLAEPLYKLRIKLEARVKALRPDLGKQAVFAILSDFSRRGAASDKDPALTAALRDDVEQAFRATNQLAAIEKQQGSLESQIKAKAAELRKRGVPVDSLIFSGHSDGANLTGESTVRLSSAEIDRLRAQEPQLFSRPRHVLLLGCYNLTETNHERWRNDVFPNASLIAGFGVQAPSRWRENAIKYIGQVLNTADALDDKMIAQNSPLDARFITTALRKLSAVTGTQAVIDYCRNIVEGQPGASKISCEEQWTSMMHQAELVTKEYLDLSTATSEPPEDPNGGTLRTFYTQLQNTCPAAKNPEIPDNEKAMAERYRASLQESAIRLINWANVQRNFQTYFADDIKEVTEYLAHLKIDARLPELDGTAGRLDFVRAHQGVERSINRALEDIRREKDGMRGGGSYARRRELDYRETGLNAMKKRFLHLYRPLYVLRGETSLRLGSDATVETILDKGGMPFSWIESATVLEKRSQE
jgi:hypothetical protein